MTLAPAQADSRVAPPMRAYTHQEIEFKVSPSRLYELLLDGQQFGEMTSAPAQIDNHVGATFTLFGGRVVGRNLELVPNQRIVQAWRAQVFPPGIYSVVRFELMAQGEGTHIVFDQASFPPDENDAVNGKAFPGVPPPSAWSQMYWDPMRKYLKEATR